MLSAGAPERHSYSLYGLDLQSAVPIEGLQDASTSAVDCELTVGPVELPPGGRAIDGDEDRGVAVWRSVEEPHAYVFEYADGTRFRIEEKGRRIVASWSSTAADMATYLLGPILAAVARLRGSLALHASAVTLDDDRAVILTGVAGAGKSTTAAALVASGARALTDDVAVLEWRDEELLVHPGYARLRLWDDSAEALYGSAESLPLLTPTWSKRFVDVAASMRRAPSAVSAIFVLAARHEGTPSIRRLYGHEAVMALLPRTSMTHLLDPSYRESELSMVAHVAEEIPLYEVIARDDLRSTSELAAAIEAEVLAP